MSRINDVIARYECARALVENGLSIFAVGDPAGAQLNAAIRRTIFALGDEPSEVWSDLLQAAKALRWRRITQPFPNSLQPVQAQIVEQLLRQTTRLRALVGHESLLDELGSAATAVRETDSPLGAVLLESILEVGAGNCVVVASGGAARAGLQEWLDSVGAVVLVPSGLSELHAGVEQSYVIAPPMFVPSSVVMAPSTDEVTFVLPAWFRNHSLPESVLGPHAEGRITFNAAVHPIGDVSQPGDGDYDSPAEDNYFPQPIWGNRQSDDREPASDEVEAWKLLLGGGLALWLDDGDRIRSLDPRQPEGDRIDYALVADVIPGTYLVLREGETERGAMYEQALRSLGSRADAVLATQKQWKQALHARLSEHGAKAAARELSARGVRSAGQVRAWADPRLICPQLDADFGGLLSWLGMPLQPTYGNAVMLRRAVYKATADLRKELEAAVSLADLGTLEKDGVLRLDLQRNGFRRMIVARVLARSPFTEIVARAQIRLPFADRSLQWLE